MLRLLLLALLLLLQTAPAWALKPSREWIATPDSLGLSYQTLRLTTPDRVPLTAWLVEPLASASDQHVTVVLAYGDTGNMSMWLNQAQALARDGYRVYLFDYRGFGHSADFTINPAQLYYPEFSTDLDTALADARRRYPQNRTGILAFSMGTIMGSEVAARSRCDFFITEGYVASPQRLVADVLQRRQKVVTLPAGAAGYAGTAAHINCPWLLFSGNKDLNTPLSDSEAAVRAGKRRQRRQVVAFEGGHLEGMYTLSEALYGDKYVTAITRFLNQKGRKS